MMNTSTISNVQPIVISDALKEQKDAGHFCDVELVLKGHTFAAHRNILAASSKYFFVIFKRNKVVKEKVRIDNFKNLEVFESFINFMYTGAISITWENVSEFTMIADEFLVKNIMDHCELFMRDHMNFSNVSTILAIANKYNLLDLVTTTLDFIRCNFIRILKQKEMPLLPKKKLKNFLVECNFHIPQRELLNFLFQWLDCNTENRETAFEELLSLINWQSIEPTLIKENASQYRWFGSNQKYLEFIRSHLKELDVSEIILKSQKSKISEINSSTFSVSSDLSFSSESLLGDDCGDKTSKLSKVTNTKPRGKLKQDHDPKINGIQKCLDCNFTWKRKPSYLCHLKTHYIGPSFQCKRCQYSSKIFSSFFNHLARHSTAFPYKCDKCERSFKTVCYLRIHKCVLTEKRNFKPMRANTSWIFQKSEISLCKHCFFETDCKAEMDHHVAALHSTVVMLKCKKCDFTCTFNSDYNRHLKTHFQGPPFKCDECDSGTFKKIFYLSNHLLNRHSTTAPFKCGLCERHYKSQRSLNNHVIDRHPFKDKVRATQLSHGLNLNENHNLELESRCSQPDCKFGSSRNLQYPANKQCKCKICGFCTTFKSIFSLHMNAHRKKFHRCRYSGCQFRTHKKHILINHMLRHPSQPDFICTVCKVKLSCYSYLKYHIRKSHKGKQSSCKKSPESRGLVKKYASCAELDHVKNLGDFVINFCPNKSTTVSDERMLSSDIGIRVNAPQSVPIEYFNSLKNVF